MKFSSLKILDVLLVYGEKLGEFENPEDYKLVDDYGSSENFAFIASIPDSDKIDLSSADSLHYNTKAYILDAEGRRVPVGAVGELYVAGYQIADGYMNCAKDTSESFIDNSFDGGDYNKLYRTGDRFRLLEDASLGFIGSRDTHLKIRGKQVELSEIVSSIRKLAYIDDVAVQRIKIEDNNELVVYVVTKEDVCNLKESICDYISEKYMIPSYVIELDEIPITLKGKVDYGALPEVDLDTLTAEYAGPTNEIEKSIVDAFENVFGKKIGIYDDFIKLGGDSLAAVQIISLLTFDLDVRTIFEKRTPYKIAQIIKN